MNFLGGGRYVLMVTVTTYLNSEDLLKYTCPSCGAKIGGLDHELDTTYKIAVKENKSLPGYLMMYADNDINAY